MAILTPDDCSVDIVGDRIRLRIAGKTHFLDAVGAMHLGKWLANAGADTLPTPEGLPRVEDVQIKAFDRSGDAQLRLTMEGWGGPMTVVIGHYWLTALSLAARGALEGTPPAGSA